MTPGAPLLLEKAQRRLRRDPDFAEVLAAVVDAPARSAGTYRRAAASAINEQRLREALDTFRHGARSTAEVQELLGLRTPQAIHRLRSRGRIVGAQLGNLTWFPEWQFRGGRLRPDLAELLDVLGRFTSDVVAMDRIMRLERTELGGTSIVEALDDSERAQTALILLGQVGA